MGSWLSGPRPSQGFSLDGADDMLPLPSAWTYEAELTSEARIPGFWDNAIPSISGTGVDIVLSSLP